LSEAVIVGVALAPTHDGDTALLVELSYPEGGRATVQVEPHSVGKILANAKVLTAEQLIGCSWSVLNVRDAVFFHAAGVAPGTWSYVGDDADSLTNSTD
jgi:hypothetical protein